MNILQEVIQQMSKEEARTYKLYAKRVETSKDRKDLELFDYVRKQGEEYQDDDAFAQIYPTNSRNTFHRLKSRVLQEVNYSLIDQYSEKVDALKLYHILSLVEFYFRREQHEVVHWYLRKAERHAAAMEHHVALDIIYSEFIRLSLQNVEINPEEYILKRKKNSEQLRRIRQLDDVLAAVVYRVKLSQTFGASGSDSMALLQEAVRELALDPELSSNTRLRFMLFEAISRLFLDRRDYISMETYLTATYTEFENENLFVKSNHGTKLKMLTFLINAVNKNGKPEESLRWAEVLKKEMAAFDGMLEGQFLFFYYNALVINYFKLDLDKTIEILEEMRGNEKMTSSGFYELFVPLNLGLAWFEKGEYRKAIRSIVQMALLDGYKAADPGLRLRLAVAELIIRFELGEYEVIQQRVRQIRKEFQSELKEIPFARDREFIYILNLLNESRNMKLKKSLVKRISRFLDAEVDEEVKGAELITYDDFINKHGR